MATGEGRAHRPLYFFDDGAMIDLDRVASATWGNRDNDVVFVRMVGDHSENGTMIAPGGAMFLRALWAWRLRGERNGDELPASEPA